MYQRLEGLGWYSFQIIKRIVESQPEHDYYFLFDREPHKEFLFHPSIKPIVVRPQARHPFLWYLWFEWSVPGILKQYEIDLFLSPDGFCSLKAECPQIMIVHDLAHEHYPDQVPFLVGKYYHYFVPKYIEKADYIFAVSQATKDDIIRHYAVREDKIGLAYNGCRDEFRPITEESKNAVRNKITSGNPYFLFVGAMHPRKNVHGLIKAFSQAKKEYHLSEHLVLIGRKAWLSDEIKSAYETSEVKDEIHFLPYQNTDQLAAITAAAAALVMPSFLEGFGVPVLEALHCDVPVMVSSTFSLPEVGGPGAIFFDPHSVGSIAKALGQKILDKEDRIRMGEEHRKKFSWDDTADLIYQKIIELGKKKF